MTDRVDRARLATEEQPEQADLPGSDEQRRALVRLLLIVAGGAIAAVVTGTARTVAVVVALIVMIMLHELGHFLTAKWSGMKVTEFFVGFGPRLWSVRKGETEYGVKAIPAGGYVKIIGMNNLEQVDSGDEERTYRRKSFPKRLVVVSAGSAMHFMIAFVLFVLAFAVVGIPRPSLEVGRLVGIEGGPSPASEAGLQVGDRIVSIDGDEIEEWSEVPPYVRDRPGQPLQFVVERGGELVTLTVTPANLQDVQVEGGQAVVAEPTGFIGIGPANVMERTSPVTAIGRAAQGVGSGIVETVKALGRVFSPGGVSAYFQTLSGDPVEGQGDGDDVRFLSPVGFTRIASQAANTGLFEVIELLILINIFVGVFNMLPLLPLDGGHVAIAVYEAVRSKIAGRRYMVDVAKLLPATYLVLFIIVFIGVTSLYLDIVRPLDNPFQ